NYMNFETGTTSIGNGSVAGFLYILPEDFDLDYYSEIFVKFNCDDEIYSEKYKNFMNEKDSIWEDLTQQQANYRYDRIIADAESELNDGKKELKDKQKEGKQELQDAEQELSDSEKKLSDAEKELSDAKQELDDGKKEFEKAEKELSDAEQKLLDAEQEIQDGKLELDNAKEKLDNAKLELDNAEKQLEEAEQELITGQQELDSSREQLQEGQSQLETGQKQLTEARAVLEQSQTELSAKESELTENQQAFDTQFAQAELVWDYLPEEQKQMLLATKAQLESGWAQIQSAKMQLESGLQELNAQQALLNKKQEEITAGWQALEEGQKKLDDGRLEYEQGLEDYETGKKEYEDGLEQYQEAEKAYQDGLEEYESGKQEYEDGLKKYQDGKQEYEDGLQKYQDGLAEYEDGKQKFADGQKEYQDGKQEFDEKIADAEQEIADAEQEIADIKKPDSYVLDRNTNISYACFESDSQIVEQIAKIFPIFFILVAALVCMTTMSRMIEEQRTQIGTFKALGYSEFAIMGKFLVYSGSASLIGCILGYFAGTVVFPQVIWLSYELMYMPIPMHYLFDWKLAFASLIASLACSMGTTWISCHHELAETSAGLMRPKAPKAGKRVFLEYIPFIWNQLKFLHKVSVRNIFRYKRRFFMMIVGISGCTALLLTGFGVNDSIAGFADVQYTEILIADAEATLKTDSGEKLSKELEQILDTQTQEYILLHQASWDLLADDKIKSISLLAPFGEMNPYMNFHTLQQEPITFPSVDEAIISNSISERYHVSLGDTITLRNEDMQELHLTVTGIFENHVYNYIFIAPETIKNQLSELPEFNTIYMNFPEDTDQYQASAEITSNESVTNIILFQDLKNRMSDMMSSLKYVVLLVIICAAGLAFIVLYNLTNINITERIREIATIKVLGFFKKETSAYVLRENIFLTALGIAVGLILGVFLHRFIMLQIIVDMV
ncbi:MAG: ABC transporter permease, partial [Oscillospiraceae bacterium]|nr:ABC transporter permease [Oscillospiraceae bacterium]